MLPGTGQRLPWLLGVQTQGRQGCLTHQFCPPLGHLPRNLLGCQPHTGQYLIAGADRQELLRNTQVHGRFDNGRSVECQL